MASRHPLLEPLYGGLRGRFHCFAPIAHLSRWKRSNIHAIYQLAGASMSQVYEERLALAVLPEPRQYAIPG